jgi:hypothetical protein
MPTTNPWILHIKKYQAAHPGMTYCTAMTKSRPSYKPVTANKTTGKKLTKTERRTIMQALLELDFKALERYLKSNSQRMKQAFGHRKFAAILDEIPVGSSFGADMAFEMRGDLLQVMGFTKKEFKDFVDQS